MSNRDEQRTSTPREAEFETKARMFASYMLLHIINRLALGGAEDQDKLQFFYSDAGMPLIEAAMAEIGGDLEGTHSVDKTTAEQIIEAYELLVPDSPNIPTLKVLLAIAKQQRGEK